MVNLAKFWSRVDKGPHPKGCWLWTGTLFKVGGYGRIGAQRAHRVAFALANGPITREDYVCHTCDNPICVRPDHLFLGTADDNMQDKKRKGRSARNFGPCPKRRHGQLSSDQSDALRKEYAAGGVSFGDLGRKYGVHSTQASRIARGVSGRRKVLEYEAREELIRRAKGGEDKDKLAEEYGVSASHVNNLRLGLARSPDKRSLPSSKC